MDRELSQLRAGRAQWLKERQSAIAREQVVAELEQEDYGPEGMDQAKLSCCNTPACTVLPCMAACPRHPFMHASVSPCAGNFPL